MNCICGSELIWGGDHDEEPDGDYSMSSNYSCPACQRLVFVYVPRPEDASEPSPL